MDYLDFKELYHHGIKGQHWGIRKYQNEDGSLTPEGKARYGYDETNGKISKEGRKVEKQDIKSAAKEAKQFRKEYRKENHHLLKRVLFEDDDGNYSNRLRGEEYGAISQKYGKRVASEIKKEDFLKSAAVSAAALATVAGLTYLEFKKLMK